MKKVELGELKEQLLSAGREALCVEHDGKLLGYFYPVSSEVEVEAAWERLNKATKRVMEETGLDEESLVQALTSSKLEQ